MLVSKKWLNQLVDGLEDISSVEIGRQLKMKTVEVEEIIEQAEGLANIVVGKVVSVERHPDADTLNICQVNVGESDNLQIVCGGSNVADGMLVALGKIGAEVYWHGEGEPVKLVKAKIRGEYSYGMICASDEIGLLRYFPKSTDKEIMDLSGITAPTGTPLAIALELDDTIFDIENKSLSNRPDLFGHYGIARELSAIFNLPLKEYISSELAISNSSALASVVDQTLCPRYSALRIDNIKVTDSPLWLKNRLLSIGLRPINNIVDITNFVMMELGQPMHAFDTDKLRGKIVVRRARVGESFLALDDRDYILNDSALVIADDSGPVALAGIIGGDRTKVDAGTTSIILESANFDAVSVRRSSNTLLILTDSSTRFEKSQDPTNTLTALARAVELLRQDQESIIVSEVTDINALNYDDLVIEFTLDYLLKKIGKYISKEEVENILRKLGFVVEEISSTFKVTVPSWRKMRDISIKEDLVEEILRMHGYENIVGELPTFDIEPPIDNRLMSLERKIKELLALEFGFTEVCSYLFESEDWLAKLGVDTQAHIRLANPVAKDRPLLRRHLLPNMLLSLENNLHRFDNIKFFETGLVFHKEVDGLLFSPDSSSHLPEQKKTLGIVYTDKSIAVPFRELNFVISRLCESVGARVHFSRGESADGLYHSGRVADIFVGDILIGRLGELHPKIRYNIEVDTPIALAEIDLETLLSVLDDVTKYRPISLYPSIVRDVAFVVDRSVESWEMTETIVNFNSLIESTELFDVYEGEKIGSDKKSVAYHIVYRDNHKTLESGTVEEIHRQLLGVLQAKFSAIIR